MCAVFTVHPVTVQIPFEDHPFLIAHLLGVEYIRSKPKFRHLVECTDDSKAYLALMGAVDLQLSRTTARFEVVLTSRRLSDVLDVDIGRLGEFVKTRRLLVQVPSTST